MTKFDASWRARCSVSPSGHALVSPIVEQRHYLRCWPAVVVARFALWLDDWRVVGACVFALPPTQTMQRYGGMTWELARLWVDDELPRNVETWFIGKCVRWIKTHRHDVTALVSYADPSAGHHGGIYRAANWTYDGMTDQERKSPRCDYVAGGRRFQRRTHIPEGLPFERIPRVSKHRFVYRFNRPYPGTQEQAA